MNTFRVYTLILVILVEGFIAILQNRLAINCVVLRVEETAQCRSCHRLEWECVLSCRVQKRVRHAVRSLSVASCRVLGL